MVVTIIDAKSFRRLFRKVPECSLETDFPSEMTEEEGNAMIRILSAQTMEEIEDLSSDTVFDLFTYIDVFSDFIDHHDCFTGSSFEQNLKALPSAMRRRIL